MLILEIINYHVITIKLDRIQKIHPWYIDRISQSGSFKL